jgi:hypothetical protein
MARKKKLPPRDMHGLLENAKHRPAKVSTPNLVGKMGADPERLSGEDKGALGDALEALMKSPGNQAAPPPERATKAKAPDLDKMMGAKSAKKKDHKGGRGTPELDEELSRKISKILGMDPPEVHKVMVEAIDLSNRDSQVAGFVDLKGKLKEALSGFKFENQTSYNKERGKLPPPKERLGKLEELLANIRSEGKDAVASEPPSPRGETPPANAASADANTPEAVAKAMEALDPEGRKAVQKHLTLREKAARVLQDAKKYGPVKDSPDSGVRQGPLPERGGPVPVVGPDAAIRLRQKLIERGELKGPYMPLPGGKDVERSASEEQGMKKRTKPPARKKLGTASPSVVDEAMASGGPPAPEAPAAPAGPRNAPLRRGGAVGNVGNILAALAAGRPEESVRMNGADPRRQGIGTMPPEIMELLGRMDQGGSLPPGLGGAPAGGPPSGAPPILPPGVEMGGGGAGGLEGGGASPAEPSAGGEKPPKETSAKKKLLGALEIKHAIPMGIGLLLGLLLGNITKQTVTEPRQADIAANLQMNTMPPADLLAMQQYLPQQMNQTNMLGQMLAARMGAAGRPPSPYEMPM